MVAIAAGYGVERKSFAGLWRPAGFWESLGCCAFVFSLSCGICVCGVMFDWGGAGSLQGGYVRLAWVPGFGVECLGGCFSRSSRSFVWAWLCFRLEVPFKEDEVVANCFQIFRLVVLYFQIY